MEGLKALNRGQVKKGWHNIGIRLYASDMKFCSSCLALISLLFCHFSACLSYYPVFWADLSLGPT